MQRRHAGEKLNTMQITERIRRNELLRELTELVASLHATKHGPFWVQKMHMTLGNLRFCRTGHRSRMMTTSSVILCCFWLEGSARGRENQYPDATELMK